MATTCSRRRAAASQIRCAARCRAGSWRATRRTAARGTYPVTPSSRRTTTRDPDLGNRVEAVEAAVPLDVLSHLVLGQRLVQRLGLGRVEQNDALLGPGRRALHR